MSHVLVVDDDADILEALAIVLEDRYQVATACNGVQALALLAAQTFDAVVVDLMMPVMDGETLIQDMREAGISVPIVLASASSDVKLLAARLAVDHITKPYDISALEEKLARLISSERARSK